MLLSLNKLKKIAKKRIRRSESLVFFINYRLTCFVLLFCCTLLCVGHFANRKISCSAVSDDDIRGPWLNSYCWSASTYSVKASYFKRVGIDVPYPGVGAHSVKDAKLEFRNYYQYVPIILLIQSILFYFPYFLWKNTNSRSMHIICDVMKKYDLQDKYANPDQICRFCGKSAMPDKSALEQVVIFAKERWGSHNLLAMKYFMCEALSTANILIQTYFLDVLFNGKFLRLGLLVESYYRSEILSDPLKLFPAVTTCTFRKYGNTGYIEEVDALCALPMNVIIAKIFLWMWVWFAILLLLSLINLTCLLLCMIFPCFRVLMQKMCYSWQENVDESSYIKLITRGNFGDWFLLLSVKKMVDEADFYRLTAVMLDKLSASRRGKKES